MSRKKNREINVFSTSAIDLFASSLGVFIILVMILFPYFGKKHKEAPGSPTVPLPVHQTLVEEKKKVDEVVTQLKTEIEELKRESEKVTQSSESKETMTQSLLEKVKSLELSNRQQQELIDELQKEQARLTKADSNREKSTVKVEDLLKEKERVRILEAQLSKSESQSVKLQSQVDKVTQQVSQLERTNQELKKKIESQRETSKEDSNFMAIIIQWPSEKHDIDLRVLSPSGKSYDFKRRAHPGDPARFTLDSRTGPGSEVWQTKQLEPGTYTIEYSFYNDYGNKSKAVVTGRIFTKNGEVEMPESQLKFPEQKTAKLKFSVSQKGLIQIL